MVQARRRSLALALVVLASLLAAGSARAGEEGAEGAPAAAEIFERLKALDGTWTGTAGPEDGEADEAIHTFRVSSAGTVVMETMFPGTEHEMINMYHLDGDDLMLTHYCAGGNQPRMRLAEVSGDGETLHFAFDGGTNLDPAKDGHIHEATVTLVDADTLEETWVGYQGGAPAHRMKIDLERAD